MRTWWALVAAMLGAVALAVIGTTPPGPAPASAPAAAFSATRAMADIGVIGRAPHPTGSAENEALRTYLMRRLRGLGLEVTDEPGTMDAEAKARLDKWRGSVQPAPSLHDVVAVLPGRDRSQPAVLLMAHHDSVWASPGAADDGAGVASILEVVRAIRQDGQPARSLIVLLTDGEEIGLEGAKAFFAGTAREGVGVIVNLETRGGGGRATMFETGADNGDMMRLFAQSVVRPVGTSLSTFIYQKLPNSTDYTVAKKLGVPGFNYAFIGRPALYHSPLATPERLDQGALQDMGRQVLDLTRGLLAAPRLPGKAPDRTFFDAFGLVFLSYASGWGWLILGLGIAGYGVAAWRRGTVGEVAGGAVALLGLTVAAGLALFLVNVVSGEGFGQHTNYYDRLAAIPLLQIQALLVCAGMFKLFRRWLPSSIGTIAGAALPLLVLAAAAQVRAPTAAYPLEVPLMLGGLALAVERFAGRAAGVVAIVVAAALGVGYMLGFGFFLLQAVGPKTPMIAAIPLAITALLLLPLIPAIDRRKLMLAGGALLIAALAVALWVRFDPIAPSVPPYSSDH